jgi:ElaB/YqjD/DUF883 family membrane-anchored ribosome-binding protein
MSRQTQAISNDMGRLVEDSRALMAANGDVAGEKVSGARRRLAAALEHGRERSREIYGLAREKAVVGALAADKTLHQHPYQAIAIGVGVGALVGYLVASRCLRNGD